MPDPSIGLGLSADPVALRETLGAGDPLDPSVRNRMERGLGSGLGHVRVHTDSHGASLTQAVEARAFAVGEHVAFGPGEYRPGTLAGDAMIAHELAHTLQQRGAPPHAAANDAGLEHDATRGAVGALGRIRSGDRGPWDAFKTSTRADGLSISRCIGADPIKAGAVTAPQISEFDEAFLDELEGSESVEESYEEYQAWEKIANAQTLQSPDFDVSGESRLRSSRALRRFEAEQAEAGESTDPRAWQEKKERFEGIFQNVAVAEAYRELERHEKLAQGELDRYSGPKGLLEIRTALEPHRKVLEQVRTEREQTIPVSVMIGEGASLPMAPPGAEKHLAAATSLAKPIRDSLVARFPIVAADDLDIERILLAPESEARAHLRYVSGGRVTSIQKTRGAIADAPSRVWKFDRAVAQARARLGIVEGSVYDLMIKDRYARVAADEMFKGLLIGALALGLGLLSFGTGTVAVLAAGAGAGISAGLAAAHLREFLVEEAASGTALNKAEALSSGDPSFFWLAFDIVLAFVDLGAAANAFRTLKPVAQTVKTVEEAEKLRAPAQALAEAEKAKAGPQAAAAIDPKVVAEQVVEGAKKQVAAQQTIKAAGAAAAKIPAAIKDQRAVAGLLKLERGLLDTVLSMFKPAALERLGKLISDFPQVTRVVEGLAAKLPAAQLRAVLGKYLLSRGTRSQQILRVAGEVGLDAKDFELIADALRTTKSAKAAAKKIGGLLIERIAARLPAGEKGILTFRRVAPGLHPNQSAQIFERWAARNIYGKAGGAERFSASTADLAKEYAAAKPKFQGQRMASDDIVRDAARPSEAGLVDFKSHLSKRNIGSDVDAVKQADNYAEAIRVGVKTPKGERIAWVEYLFANRESAEASYGFLRTKFVDRVKVFFVDDKGVKTLFVPLGP